MLNRSRFRPSSNLRHSRLRVEGGVQLSSLVRHLMDPQLHFRALKRSLQVAILCHPKAETGSRAFLGHHSHRQVHWNLV